MVKIEIDETLWKNSTQAVIETMKEACDMAVKETCEEIQKTAKELVPVKTGKLRDSIQIKVDKSQGTVYSDASYAEYVENGTRYMKAKPFLRPAYNSEAEKLKKRVVKNFK